MGRQKDIRDKTALVTGASSGLGADFARELARQGAHLILVARREERLRQLQAEIKAAQGVQVDVVSLDLAVPGAPQALYDQLKGAGKAVDVLVNNAGYGVFGDFLSQPWEKQENMLALDVVALTHMTRLFLPEMVSRGFGAILQVASIAAYQPSPTYASYGGAKSYVLNFSEALHYELRGSGVTVTTISPGVTATEFFDVAGQQPALYHRLMMMESEEVARQGVRALLHGKASVVPGFVNSLLAGMARIAPSWMSAPVTAWLMSR